MCVEGRGSNESYQSFPELSEELLPGPCCDPLSLEGSVSL